MYLSYKYYEFSLGFLIVSISATRLKSSYGSTLAKQ